jgi:hypothetical protein
MNAAARELAEHPASGSEREKAKHPAVIDAPLADFGK